MRLAERLAGLRFRRARLGDHAQGRHIDDLVVVVEVGRRTRGAWRGFAGLPWLCHTLTSIGIDDGAADLDVVSHVLREFFTGLAGHDAVRVAMVAVAACVVTVAHAVVLASLSCLRLSRLAGLSSLSGLSRLSGLPRLARLSSLPHLFRSAGLPRLAGLTRLVRTGHRLRGTLGGFGYMPQQEGLLCSSAVPTPSSAA